MDVETSHNDHQRSSALNKEMSAENETSSVASATSMDSSSASLPSSSKGQQGSVSALVAKSKKAAFSLWTLLHAKVG